jgi:sugar lactone lactonase YvrE
MLGAQPSRLEVRAEERVPLGLGHRRGVEVGVHTRVVDEYCGRPEALCALGDEIADVGLRGDVGRDEQRPARGGELALGARAGLAVAPAEADRQSVCEQALDGSAADAARSAGDKRYARDMITLSMDVTVEARAADQLGEGPVWLPGSARLLRVDIHAPAIVVRDVGSGSERRRPTSDHVGFALPAAGGGLVAGVGRELVQLADLDAEPVPIAAVEPDRPRNRFNDAAVDAHGRLWAGTMSTTREPGTAALYRLLPGGTPEIAIAGATISNGLDWNLDATRLYYIDSTTQRVDAIDFDLDRGRLGKRRPFAVIDPADGLCVDAEGGVWIALFGGGAIRRYRPDGTLEAQLPLPVTNPTSLAFGGPELRDLYVTSARHRLTPAQLAAEPLAGSLLRLRPGVRGRPSVAAGVP